MGIVNIESNQDSVFTIGLKQVLGFEIIIYRQVAVISEYIKLLRYLVDFIKSNSVVVKDGETIAYFSWLLKFTKNRDSYEIWEAKQDGSGFQKGCEMAIQTFVEQCNVCRKYNASPVFPSFGQKIVLSKGVYDGEKVEAVRYPSPSHMSGWWLTTDLFDGNISSLQTDHFYHLAFNRPDILKYLALPFGYRFCQSETTEIWFDISVSNEPIS